VKDFWLSCGHHLLDRLDGGGLAITDEFLKLYLARPELTPPPDACMIERTLHAALLAEPRRPISAAEVASIADADARENYELLLAWRDQLLKYPTIEAAYLALARQGMGKTPPLFLNQLVHVILRNALDGCDDPFVLRAAELLFRAQRVTSHEGALLAADEERVTGTSLAPMSPLVSMLEVAIEPLIEANEVPFTWYVGLDAAGTKIGDALWRGEALDEATRARIVGLYRLTFFDPTLAGATIGRDPVYLILAMTPDQVLRMKPQNLVVGLPIRRLETVS